MSEDNDTRPIMVFDLAPGRDIDFNSQEYWAFVDACRHRLETTPTIWIKVGLLEAKTVSSVREIRDVATGRRHDMDNMHRGLQNIAWYLLCMI